MARKLRQLLWLLDPTIGWKLSGLLMLMFVCGGLEMVGLGLFFPFLQLLADPSKVLSLPLLGPALSTFVGGDPARYVVPACFVLFFFYLFKNILLAVLSWVNFRFCYSSEALLQERLLGGYFLAPFEQFVTRNSAEMMRTAISSSRSVFKAVMVSYLGLIMESVLALAAVGALMLIEPKGALTVALFMSVLVLLLYLPLRRFLAQRGALIQETLADQLKAFQQGLGIQKEARVFGRESYFLRAFSQATQRNARAFTQLSSMQQVPRFMGEVIVLGALLGYIVTATSGLSNIGDALPILGLFGAAALRLLPSTNRIILHLGNIREGKAAVELVLADMVARRDETSRLGSVEERPVSFAKELIFDDVAFSYPNSESFALDKVRLSIPKGKAIALVGPSGAGKSTLADLLLGLLLPTSGKVLADGVPFDIRSRDWRKRLGYVPQFIYLLDDTLKRNIAFGIPDEQIDDRSIERAVAMSGLSGVAAALPEGLETVIGERGARLSGGQRQRIGIARALYHQPELLVFDEATSALDGGTEQDIIEAIESLRGVATMVIIAHRMTTVRGCDSIVLLEAGRIVDQGGFNELMERSALFQRMAGENRA